MKKGKSLQELAAEVERQASTRKDYVAKTSALEMVAVEGMDLPKGAELQVQGNGRLSVNTLAHRQIGEHVGIPAKYYDRMLTEAPELLASNVNHWFHKNPAERMVRTLDNKARAFLSSGYRPLENLDLCEAALPVLLEQGVEIVSCEITERRLYIKAVDSRVNRDIPKGHRMGDGSHVIFDTVSPVLCLSNSEVGEGALSIETGILTRGCTNLAWFATRSMRKFHVGAKHDLTEAVEALLSDRTKRATDTAVWLQVADVVRGAFDAAKFDAAIGDIRAMGSDKIEGNPVKVVELASRRFNLTGDEQGSVLRHLIEGADLSRYGIFNAITRTAEDLGDYDRATELERLGGQVIELKRDEWKVLAEAA